MRSRTRYVRLLGAGAALLAAASLSLAATGTAHAAPKEKAKADTTNASSPSPLTATAKAAGAKKFGAHATYEQSLSAYWTPARMAAATPIEDDTAFQDSAKKYDADQKAQRKAGKKPVTNDGPERSVNGAASKVFSTTQG